MSPIPATELAARLGRWSAGRGPLYLLLAARLRALIDDGELPPGTGLPTDRALAVALSAGRTTVVAAYDLLRDEGRLLRRQGSGTWVAGAAPAQASTAEPTTSPVFLHLLDQPDHVTQFACAGPLTPPAALRAAYRRALDDVGDGLGYHPAGHPRLRRALAGRYGASPGEFLVTTGGQQALSLLTRALTAPGDEVVVQAPTYPGMLEVLREHAAVAVPVPADGSGFAAALALRPAFGYLIAACHNPTGRHLAEPRRREIVAAALREDVPLVVDDVLAELAFDGPLSVMKGVIVVGSLSKVVWGGLRVGWVHAPAPLINRLARLKAVHDLGSGVLDQLAASHLVGDLTALAAARALSLRRRHDHLCAELRERLPSWTFEAASGGQTLWVRLPYGDAAAYAQAALRHGVAVLPGGQLDPTGGSHDRLRLPFVASPADITAAVLALAQAWQGYSGERVPVPLPAIAV
ncbi:GntR family transcriptional regulator [Actinoplanes lobatus]|uniref:DNA-binding transcriptional MocR family regulator n=1 Tax=Actinoplanes lobatus TaxID=113568 RepID=A0A7W7HM41_9ACTN|nr:PLP-dependent aminotransferase family protein [Actinoplanes lobatus]MBB4753042.1 DNA-binding transcriptional MocR family regulator [Actinoplanes lobatus]GGN87316.1 GntR family transcriptional regulator [Actinoplanes lobatus]GIE39649.1 GntR family transcriptional regulator [Actinoplanes lobatus]